MSENDKHMFYKDLDFLMLSVNFNYDKPRYSLSVNLVEFHLSPSFKIFENYLAKSKMFPCEHYIFNGCHEFSTDYLTDLYIEATFMNEKQEHNTKNNETQSYFI